MTSRDPSHARWRKSSYSSGNTNCVEVAAGPGLVGVRDSKNVDGPALVVPATAWRDLLTGLTSS